MSNDVLAIVDLATGYIRATGRCPENSIWEQPEEPGFLVVAVPEGTRSHLHKIDLTTGPPYQVEDLTVADLTQKEHAWATQMSVNLREIALARGDIVDPYPTPEQLELSL